jgi:hypothetical protein
MNLKRSLSEDEFNYAFVLLEQEVQKIVETHSEYFKDKKNPNRIDYMQVSGQPDWTGLSIYNIPFITFIDQHLSEEIKNEVRKKFIEIVCKISES